MRRAATLAALCWATAACRSPALPPPAPNRTPSPGNAADAQAEARPDPLALLEQARSEFERAAAELETLASNRDAAHEALQEQAAALTEEHLLARIPLEPDLDGLRLQIEAACRAVRLPVGEIEVALQPEPRLRPPPARHDALPYPWTDEQLARPIAVTLRLRRGGEDAAPRLLAALAARPGRLIDQVSTHAEGREVRLEARAWMFRTPRPPMPGVELPRLEAVFTRTGLPADGPDCTQARDPEACRRLLDGLRARAAQLRMRQREADLTAALQAEHGLWEARRAFLRAHLAPR